jgi:hypothetical protein
MIEEPLNQLFQFLRTSFKAVGDAHRTNLRRHASTPARISWGEGDKRQTIRARLVDISRAGAGLLTAVAPPSMTQVRLRLMGREPTPWIEAEILGVEPESRSRHRVRLRFRDPCPTYFLRVAVLGPVTPDEEESAASVPCADPLDLTLPPAARTSTGSIL